MCTSCENKNLSRTVFYFAVRRKPARFIGALRMSVEHVKMPCPGGQRPGDKSPHTSVGTRTIKKLEIRTTERTVFL